MNLEKNLFEKFGITKPKSITDLFKIQEFFNEELIKRKKEENKNYRELDFYDIRDCILDEIQELKKELPYKFNFRTYKFKEFSPENLKEEFVDIVNFLICKAIKNERVYYFENAWKNFQTKGFHPRLESISKNNLNIAIRIFEYWSTEREFSILNSMEIEELTVNSYLELGEIFGFSKETIYEQYWKKFLFNCKRYLKLE